VIRRGTPLLQEAPKYNKTWLVIPMKAELKTQNLTTNWEAQKAQWFVPTELEGLALMPGFPEVLQEFMPIGA
jgi:hypothetical protein